MQRRATKIIPTLAVADLPYGDRLKELNLPTLSYRRRMRGWNEMNTATYEMKDYHLEMLDLRGHNQRIQKPRAGSLVSPTEL